MFTTPFISFEDHNRNWCLVALLFFCFSKKVKSSKKAWGYLKTATRGFIHYIKIKERFLIVKDLNLVKDVNKKTQNQITDRDHPKGKGRRDKEQKTEESDKKTNNLNKKKQA